jgi:hypothetical protein
LLKQSPTYARYLSWSSMTFLTNICSVDALAAFDASFPAPPAAFASFFCVAACVGEAIGQSNVLPVKR